MKNILSRFFLKELVILGLYSVYALSLLVTSSIYYQQLHMEPEKDESPVNRFDVGTFNLEAVEKLVNFTSQLFRSYFPEDEDAWRICSILGIGFGVFDITVILFTTLIIYLICVELIRRVKAEGSPTSLPLKSKGVDKGTEICAKIFFITSIVLTFIFSTLSALALLATGGLGGKKVVGVHVPHLTPQLFQSARAFFGTVALPAFVSLVFFVSWFLYSFCVGISCAWTSTGTDVLGRSGFFDYIRNSQASNKVEKINRDVRGSENYAMESSGGDGTQRTNKIQSNDL